MRLKKKKTINVNGLDFDMNESSDDFADSLNHKD